MKALTILQPWASLIAVGAKQIETRSWATKYRGPIAIHAGKGKQYIDFCNQQIFWANLWPYEVAAQYSLQERIERFLPLGKVIAIADLVDCLAVVDLLVGLDLQNGQSVRKAILENGLIVTGNELAFGDYTPGRYAWILANVRRIEPVPAKGMQGLWNWEGDFTCLTQK